MNRRHFIKIGLIFVPSYLAGMKLIAGPQQVIPKRSLAFKNTGSVGGCSPSYTNTGGSGNRTSIITALNSSNAVVGDCNTWLNGVTSGETLAYWNGQTNVGAYLRFDFSTGKTITECKYYQQNTTSHGDWKWQGSDDAAAWTDIGSSFTLGGVATQTITTLSANSTAYRYYQMTGVSGSTSTSPYIYEFEFKICPV